MHFTSSEVTVLTNQVDFFGRRHGQSIWCTVPCWIEKNESQTCFCSWWLYLLRIRVTLFYFFSNEIGNLFLIICKRECHV